MEGGRDLPHAEHVNQKMFADTFSGEISALQRQVEQFISFPRKRNHTEMFLAREQKPTSQGIRNRKIPLGVVVEG